jgi:parallel beta-helix repeat protein
VLARRQARRSRRSIAARGMILAAAVAGCFALTGGEALASPVGCGDTITKDTKLNRDLTDCPNNGIVIGADHITLDLNGHTIDGDGEFVQNCPADQLCDVGVVNDGHNRVTIKGGSIQEFGVGVFVVGAGHHRLHDLSLSSNLDFGMLLGSSTRSRIEKNSFVDTGISGLVVFDSNSTRIERNSVSGSTGFGIYLTGVNQSDVQDNALDGNEHGIAVFDGSSRNTVRRNFVSRGGGSAIDIGGPANRVVNNRLTDDGDGIVVADFDDNLISRNTITGTGQLTDPAESGGFGIILDGADSTTVDRNIVTGGRGPAILVTSLEAPTASEHNVVTDNVANSTLSDGILVNENATATLLERNRANRSGGDGIDVDASGTKLTRNTANRNHDLGIEAVPGTIDGGGNKASGNGNPAQCTNVVCS